MQPTIVCGHNWLVSFSWKRKMQIGSLQMLSLLTCTYVGKLEYMVESPFKNLRIYCIRLKIKGFPIENVQKNWRDWLACTLKRGHCFSFNQ